MIRLYQNALSPFCHRVRIMLAEKELDYQTVNVDLPKKENRTDQFLRLNPLGKVPVLADEDLILFESFVINEYLNEEYPFPELLPEDPQEKASARLWCAQVDALVAYPGVAIFLAQRAKEKGGSVDEAKIEEDKQKIQKFFELADKNLKNREYLMGAYSLADIAFAPWVFLFEKVGIAVPDLPNLSVWLKRLSTKNTILKTRAQ